MGHHADAGRSRGLANWVIITAIAVLVVAATTVGYIVVVKRSNTAKAAVCTSAVSLAIAAGSGAAPAIKRAAAAYNDTKPIVRSSCMTATVTAVTDSAAFDGLTGRWRTKNGPAPGLWIPDSTASIAALDAAAPTLAAGHSTEPLAWSPVVLAMHASDSTALSSVSWSDLPTASGPDGSAALPHDRHLVVAFPPVQTNRASSYALQSVLAGNNATTSMSTAAIQPHRTLLTGLATEAPSDAATTSDALHQLASATTGSSGETGENAVTAVPVVEAELAHFDNAAQEDAQEDAQRPALTAVHPNGSTVGDALIAAPITASWTDRTTTGAASDFQAFLTSVPGQQILADQGWRTVSAHDSKPLAAVNTQTPVTMVPDGGPDITLAIAVALGQAEAPPPTSAPPVASSTPTTSLSPPPATTTSPLPETTPSSPSETLSGPEDLADDGPILTVIVDTSTGMGTKDKGATLLEWVKKALPDLFGGSVTDRAGLWAYSDGSVYPPTGFPEMVSTGLLTDDVTVPANGGAEANGDNVAGGADAAGAGADGATVTEPRSTALAAAANGLKPDGERWAYGALMEALEKIPDAGVDGRKSRVLLITSGADETPGTPRQMVLDSVHKGAASARIDVIGLGDAVPVQAYTDIAAAGGGQYIPVVDVDKLGQQLVDLLTLED